MITMDKFKEIMLLLNLSGIGKGRIYKNYWDILCNAKDEDDLINKIEKQSNFSKKVLEMAKKDAEELYDYIVQSDIHVITVFDEDYPKKLEVMENKRPLVLYIKGNADVLSKSNLAVIGTRKPSENSVLFEENLVKNLVDSTDCVIVSGLALGCDKIAHKATVDENKPTIAILPSGVDVITPASNKKLAQEIIETGGCLLSEYKPDAKAFKGSYVERDNLVAAFSDAALVVECGVKSGTMHTVNFADAYKKQIYAYLPDERPEDSYDGNEEILNHFEGSLRVGDIGEFIEDLKTIKVKKPKKSGQQTLF